MLTCGNLRWVTNLVRVKSAHSINLIQFACLNDVRIIKWIIFAADDTFLEIT